MNRVSRLLLALTVVSVIGIGAASTATAGNPQLLASTMASIPTGGLVINDVVGGGVPWAIDHGTAALASDGHLFVNVSGLVVAATHVNPVQTGRAIVTCAGHPPISTAAVPFSSSGNATVFTRVDLPSPCLAPVVFFAGVTAAGDRWFAVTGV